MREREKGDVILDICPQCRGVWLDAGELDKLTVRESRYYDDDDDDDEWRRDRGERDSRERVRTYGRDDHGRPRKKRGFLSSMLENLGGEGGED